MAANESGALFTTIETVCTDAMSVTMTVPVNGTVVVTGVTRLRISHTTGTEDRWFIGVDNASANCRDGAGTWLDSITQDIATDTSVWVSAMAQRSFTVTPGTSTFYFSGRMVQGQDAADVFIYVGLTAVFYPS